ncbi:HypC/HybG/HupF family hydrogenase formation chaperone [Labilithrix luteola]|uniref:HypC/HybG/HupF family hydrogenase formation chaperone n=1 Tax=Labilithrix luteola TaxID=1391654 RepID=UPI000B29937D|nr:HypC/HybG/HupF family hydrogenase formation chaperone [Labilithrix luteola]
MCLGIPGELMSVREEGGLRVGKVRFAGILRDVCLECVPDAVPGDYVLVHVGFAIARLDAEEAARTYALLEELGQTEELVAGDDVVAPSGASR